MSKELVNAIADMEYEQVLALSKEMLVQGTDPVAILDDCRVAMEIVGKRFEEGEYFLAELIQAGEILKEIAAEVKPRMSAKAAEANQGAKVLVGTVKGDIHDIGKDIVVFMLDVNGFQVKDMGVDVPVESFVEEIKSFRPAVVALSGFITVAYNSMKETVEAIEAAGLRDQLKIMVGGGTVDQQVCNYSRADAFGADAVAAVRLARQWTGAQ